MQALLHRDVAAEVETVRSSAAPDAAVKLARSWTLPCPAPLPGSRDARTVDSSQRPLAIHVRADVFARVVFDRFPGVAVDCVPVGIKTAV